MPLPLPKVPQPSGVTPQPIKTRSRALCAQARGFEAPRSCADLRKFGDLSFGLGDAQNLFNCEACPLAAGRLRKVKSSSQKNGSGAGVRSTKGDIELRLWLSGPRIGWFRPGISLGREDLHPRLPSWRRYEYREVLKASKHGQPITNA